MSSNNVGHFINQYHHYTATLRYTSLHLSTLYFLSFTLNYSPIWLNPSTFPIVLFHLTTLNQTQYGSHIPKLISKVMNPFTALKNVSTFHFTSPFFYFIFFTYPVNPSLHFTLLFTSTTHFPSLHFPFYFIAFTSPTDAFTSPIELLMFCTSFDLVSFLGHSTPVSQCA